LQKILIIQTAFIGDVILTIPLIRVVSQKFPQAQTHFLTIPASKNTVETLPYISKLWIYDKHNQEKGLSALLQLIKKIRAANFDMVISPHRSLRTALLAFLSRIPVRIGFKNSVGWFFYTNRVDYLSKLHEIERNLSLVKPLSIQIKQKELPEINITEEDRSGVDQWFEEQRIIDESKVIAIAPGSVWYTKRWPSEYYRELAEKLSGSGNDIVFIGSKDDQYLFQEINKPNNPAFHDGMGRFSLRQTGEIIRRSQILISNDSAPTHLGVAVRTKVLTVFGSTIPEFGFYPYGDDDHVIQIENLYCRPCTDHGRHSCPQKHFRCMMEITPEMVFQKAMDMISASSEDRSH
jgi:heptosyltransferase-2